MGEKGASSSWMNNVETSRVGLGAGSLSASMASMVAVIVGVVRALLASVAVQMVEEVIGA